MNKIRSRERSSGWRRFIPHLPGEGRGLNKPFAAAVITGGDKNVPTIYHPAAYTPESTGPVPVIHFVYEG